MFRARQTQAKRERRGVILLVVISLLTLFALIGITFVLYAESEANSSRIFRESENVVAGNAIPADQLLDWALGQLLFGPTEDLNGSGSCMKGNSLDRLIYGYNDQVLNTTPFNGVGRLRTGPVTYGAVSFPDDYVAINYTY